jgi:hypothetical protein
VAVVAAVAVAALAEPVALAAGLVVVAAAADSATLRRCARIR